MRVWRRTLSVAARQAGRPLPRSCRTPLRPPPPCANLALLGTGAPLVRHGCVQRISGPSQYEGHRNAIARAWNREQLGQGRGGFYAYDCLENLVGGDIHSADQIVPEWQSIAVGDDVRLHPEVGPCSPPEPPSSCEAVSRWASGATLRLHLGLHRVRTRGCNHACRRARAVSVHPPVEFPARRTCPPDQLHHEPAHAARHQAPSPVDGRPLPTSGRRGGDVTRATQAAAGPLCREAAQLRSGLPRNARSAAVGDRARPGSVAREGGGS
jgi:hypothetical protein